MLARAAGRAVLWRTEAEWIRGLPAASGQPLCAKHRAQLATLRSNGEADLVKGMTEGIDAFLERGIWFEQEVNYSSRAFR